MKSELQDLFVSNKVGVGDKAAVPGLVSQPCGLQAAGGLRLSLVPQAAHHVPGGCGMLSGGLCLLCGSTYWS